MKNAHMRIGTIELAIERKKTVTRVRAYFDRFAAERDGPTHMISIFGNDAEIAAISGAISQNMPLVAKTPDGRSRTLCLGEKATTYKGHIQIVGRKKPLRHLLACSHSILQNGTDSKVYTLNNDPSVVWATVVSYLGLPAVPEWADAAIHWLKHSGKLVEMDGYQCSPVCVAVSREEMLEWIGSSVREQKLRFPDYDGPIFWPQFGVQDIVFCSIEEDVAGDPRSLEAAA